jgi:hypothetical protein
MNPLSWNVIVGSLLVYLSSTLSSSGGVGGGILNVGVLLVVFGVDYDTAVRLSLAALFGNYCCQVVINIDKRRRENQSIPLIYFDAVTVLLPCELAGSCLGVVLSGMLPDSYLLIASLGVILFAMAYLTDKAVHLYSVESGSAKKWDEPCGSTNMPAFETSVNRDSRLPNEEQFSDPIESSSLLVGSHQSHSSSEGKVDEGSVRSSPKPLPVLQLPWVTITLLVTFWAVYSLIYGENLCVLIY